MKVPDVQNKNKCAGPEWLLSFLKWNTDVSVKAARREKEES